MLEILHVGVIALARLSRMLLPVPNYAAHLHQTAHPECSAEPPKHELAGPSGETVEGLASDADCVWDPLTCVFVFTRLSHHVCCKSAAINIHKRNYAFSDAPCRVS